MPISSPILGIPDRKMYGDVDKLSPGQLLNLVVQLHKADRAGIHRDVRIGDPSMGLLSWATRHPLPGPGERRALFQQPLHSFGYKDFTGTIEKGYGKGTVEKDEEGEVLINKITPKALYFTLASRKHPERFVLVKPTGKEDKRWLLINATPTEPFGFDKPKYTSVPQEQASKILDNLQPGSAVQAKIDGASTLYKLMKDKIEAVSYRTAANTGYPILHSERIFHRVPYLPIPDKYVGSVLKGELYGTKGDNAIPVQELSGLLNSSVAKSIKDQRSRGINLKNMLFDIEQFGKEKIDRNTVPYEQRRKMLEEIIGVLPNHGKFELPYEAKTTEEAKALLQQILASEHPLTREGLVVHPPVGRPTKIKAFDEHDVHIRNIFPGEGKYKDNAAGGFEYSDSADSPVLGRVGTGLSDRMRQTMWQDPSSFIGRVARVRAQERLPSGAYRVPSFISLHEDYPSSNSNPRTIDILLRAKEESDRKNYDAKSGLMRDLMLKRPEDFMVDSSQGRFFGITHKPTGFRVHLPKTVVPTAVSYPPQQEPADVSRLVLPSKV